MAQPDTTSEELERRVEEIERRVERLKSLYEQYFQGIERLEPRLERTQLHNIVQELRKSRVRNTALRFRINQLVARMNTYENYWNRTTRQIEEGTYRRDLFRARYRQGLRSEQQQQSQQTTAEAAETPATPAPSQPAAPAATAPARGAQGGGPLDPGHVRALYNAYLTAKRRCKEPTKGITEQALTKTLQRQVPTIMKQYKCKSVEFKVVIKQGKAVLKAVPKF